MNSTYTDDLPPLSSSDGKLLKTLIENPMRFSQYPDLPVTVSEYLVRFAYPLLFKYSPYWENICLSALTENPKLIRYIDSPTRKLSLVAVSQDGNLLRYIHDQSEDICLAAVKQDGMALMFVQSKTEKICKTALESNGLAIIAVENKTRDLCTLASRTFPLALKLI